MANHQAEGGHPLVIPEGAVVCRRARRHVGRGKEWGLSLATPVIVKYRDDKTDTRTELEYGSIGGMGFSPWRHVTHD